MAGDTVNEQVIISFSLFGLMFLFLAGGLPIAICLGLSAALTLWLFDIAPIEISAQMIMTSLDSFVLLAIPFFILAGTIISETSIGSRLVDFFNALFGRFPGGLSITSVFTCFLFGGLTGSAAAETAAVTSIMADPMDRHGYPRHFTASLIAAASTTANLVPPSIALILYGVLAKQSIGDLFLAGVVPGLVITILFAAGAVALSQLRGYGKANVLARQRLGKATLRAAWALFAPVLILGGIRLGIFTPTESAIFVTLYALFIALYVYRDITWRDVPRIFERAAVVATSVMFIVATATLFAWIINSQGIPEFVSGLLLSKGNSEVVIILSMLGLLIVTGMFLDATSTLFILLPILFPVAVGIGMDPIHFGVFMVMALNLGLITPPVGLCLFVGANIARAPLVKVSIAAVPWMAIMILAILLVAFIPSLSLVLL
jgi:C4-dicarboxylate transporter DctM subunit